MKTPEEYFIENVKLPDEKSEQDFTSAETAFMDKYLGVDGQQLVENIDPVDPRSAEVPGFLSGLVNGADDNHGSDEGYEERLMTEEEVQLVSFVVGDQEYALPIMSIQEVVKKIPVTLLPSAPLFMQGIINLRGRVTPVLDLRHLLNEEKGEKDKFVVVCKHKGLQLGLAIHGVRTMYRADSKDIVWGVESEVGVRSEFLLGLYKYGEKLVNILSVDRLVEQILTNEGAGNA
ncbi:chemotaxis protein CheW [Maridesulfovibrio bastinii]|uniref:chemotaxis protein CheW n=1 Tax=Maridesulfovibrio bastinii TaxID=47157 RepID=UPI000422D5AE|nr:chemotaxis protein CheW [Maridesulfovibrio bastinii]